MAADVLKYGIGNSSSTTLSGSVSNTDTSAPLTSDSNFQAESGEGMILIDEGQATEELAYATGLSGSSLTIPLANRGLEGGTAQAHDAGATVKGILTVGMWNSVIDALTNLVSKATGALDTTKVVDLTTSQALSNKTLTSPVINTQISGTAIATGAEVTTGTDDTQIVTPKALGDAGVNTRLKSKLISSTRDLTASTGSVAYTGVGFTPTSIYCISNVNGSAYGTGIGMVDSARTSGGFYLGGDGNNYNDTNLVHVTVSGGEQTASVSSFDADGFTLSWTKSSSPTGTATLKFLCFR